MDKCIWIVDLVDGTRIFQDDDRAFTHTPSAWKRLGYYVDDNPNNKIAKMRLRFGTNIVELLPDRPTYFYSRGLLQAATQTHGLDFHIIGWPVSDDEVLLTWYKTPELVVTEYRRRKISECKKEQLIGVA